MSMGPREQFYNDHGGEAKSIVTSDGWVLFADGAMMEVSSYGVMIGPPTDRRERLGVHERYCEVQLRRATERFYKLKNDLAGRLKDSLAGRPADVPRDDEIIKLQAYQAKVQKCQRDLQKVRDQFDTRTAKQKREAAEMDAAIAEHKANVLQTVESIKI